MLRGAAPLAVGIGPESQSTEGTPTRDPTCFFVFGPSGDGGLRGSCHAGRLIGGEIAGRVEDLSLEEHIMFVAVAVILVVAWLLGFSVFHVAGGLIHLLLILALIAIVWHFIGGRRGTV